MMVKIFNAFHSDTLENDVNAYLTQHPNLRVAQMQFISDHCFHVMLLLEEVAQ